MYRKLYFVYYLPGDEDTDYSHLGAIMRNAAMHKAAMTIGAQGFVWTHASILFGIYQGVESMDYMTTL